MPGCVFFTDTEPRFARALQVFDPLARDPILRFFDPEARRTEGRWRGWWVVLRRLFWTWFAVVGFILAGVWSEVPALGHGLWDDLGLARDFGAWQQYLGAFAWWATLLVGRRTLGLLVMELEGDGVVPDLGERLRHSRPSGKVLRTLEWISRLSPRRSLVWAGSLGLLAVFAYWTFLTDGIANWITHPAAPGTALYWLNAGREQPTISGVVSVTIIGVMNSYAAFLAARLVLAFALLCDVIGKAEPRIIPVHPDAAGGLLPVGKVSLLFSLFTLQAGLAIVINIIQSYVRLRSAGAEMAAGADMMPLNLTALGLYLLFGPLLFFLPLMPLRRAMASAKRAHLVRADALLREAEQEYAADLEERRLRPDIVQSVAALNELHAAGEEMTVWPFDRQTFLRFAGVLFTPLLPLLGGQAAAASQRVMRFFFPGL